ncbi:hypothetical protein BDN70DRAFT_375353 [Pholiota conissans]|uniref:MYND-type domain-containing protein n=1 Tax=Pholiota conissans TaxID=109636 RepID=A0A9P5YR60_9AGAR|nr:hypothetical protein BDN70DRAFT_375353 [Pholiota conissans]
MEKKVFASYGEDTQISSPSVAYLTVQIASMATSLSCVKSKSVAQRSTTKRWPTRPEDLIPFGPREFIDNIIIWSKFVPGMPMLGFASMCIHYCGSLLIPHIIEPPFTPHILDAGKKNSSIAHGLPFVQGEIRCTCLMTLYIDPLPNVLLYPGICEQDADAVSNALSKNQDDFPEIGELQAKITAGQLTGEENEKYHHLTTYAFLARQAFTFIRYKRYTLQCSARDCPNSIHSTGKSFQRCDRCRVAFYCSKLCQVADWTASHQFPHKTLCKLVRRVCDIAGTDVIFRDTYSPAELPSSLEGDGVGGDERDSSEDALAALVADKWRQADVAPLDLYEITRWASYKIYSPTLPEKRACDAGYLDYDEKLAELSEHGGVLKARSFSSTN